MRLALIHYVLLELQRVAIVRTTMGVLLQWNLLVLLCAAHTFVLLPVLLVRLLHLLPHRFLVRISFHIIMM